MMEKRNPIFEKNYEHYIRQLDDIDLPQCQSVLNITVDANNRTARIPFFKSLYTVSRFGVVDDQGKRPDYGICVILLKYLLMCPQRIPPGRDWISYRDFKDSGQAQNAGLASYASQAISTRYAGNVSRLKASIDAIHGRPPEFEFPYDISVIFKALPRLPILLLFNDKDEQFPAQTSILYERRAESFLDAECRIMVDWYLLEHLKSAEKL